MKLKDCPNIHISEILTDDVKLEIAKKQILNGVAIIKNGLQDATEVFGGDTDKLQNWLDEFVTDKELTI